MKYFTKEEALAVLENNDVVELCSMFEGSPNREAMQALRDTVWNDPYRDEPYWMACIGFILGFAAGKRHERQRPKLGRVP